MLGFKFKRIGRVGTIREVLLAIPVVVDVDLRGMVPKYFPYREDRLLFTGFRKQKIQKGFQSFRILLPVRYLTYFYLYESDTADLKSFVIPTDCQSLIWPLFYLLYSLYSALLHLPPL